MELRQIKSFLVLAEELHFNRAAQRLHIVQPALTKQIKDLEAELGVILFERTKRKVELSLSGSYFRGRMKEMWHLLEEAKNRVKAVEDGNKGELRIGYVGSCIHTFLPQFLSILHEKYPKIQTYLNEMTTSSQLLAIEKGELDIAFLRNPPQYLYEQKQVFCETFSLVLPENHAISKISFKGLHQVSQEEFILPTRSDGALYYQVQLDICEEAGFLPNIAHETVHGHTVLRLIEHGLGISFLPTSFQRVNNARVKFIELDTIKQRSEITALWNKTNPNPSLKRFLGVF